MDEYLAGLSDENRAALERLRKIVIAAAPGAEECISYNLPAFRLQAKVFFWFGAAAKHCAIYGVSETEAGEFKKYDTSKGTLRFQPDHPLPDALVRRLVIARIEKTLRKEKPGKKTRGGAKNV